MRTERWRKRERERARKNESLNHKELRKEISTYTKKQQTKEPETEGENKRDDRIRENKNTYGEQTEHNDIMRQIAKISKTKRQKSEIHTSHKQQSRNNQGLAASATKHLQPPRGATASRKNPTDCGRPVSPNEPDYSRGLKKS